MGAIKVALRLARASARMIENAVRGILGSFPVANELAMAAPLLCGKKIDLREYELVATIDWLGKPEGTPPSARFNVLRRMLRECDIPIDDEELETLFGGEL